MAMRIRLTRIGKRHQPSYRIVATDSRNKRDGKFNEVLGWYNPLTEPAQVNYNQQRVNYWLSQGAKMSDRVRLLITGEKRQRTKTRKKTQEIASEEKS
jgi:small subunit ribosomal protein S16